MLRFAAAGDVLRTLPVLEALHALWPDARLVMVTHARCAPLLAGLRVPAEVVTLPQNGSLRTLAKRLRALHVTHILDVHGSLRSRALSMLLWPRPVVRWQKHFVREWLRVRIAHAPQVPHATCATRQRAALRTLTGHDRALPPMRLHAPSSPRRRAQADVQRIGLSPGAAWASKRWPVAHWAALARTLMASGAAVEVFGSAAERPLVDAVLAHAPQAQARTGLPWPAMATALADLDAFVCGDSGPLHLAQALQVPTVGLFFSTPPQAYDEVATCVLAADAACSPCSFYGRPHCPRGHFACLEGISVAAVAGAVQQVSKGTSQAAFS